MTKLTCSFTRPNSRHSNTKCESSICTFSDSSWIPVPSPSDSGPASSRPASSRPAPSRKVHFFSWILDLRSQAHCVQDDTRVGTLSITQRSAPCTSSTMYQWVIPPMSDLGQGAPGTADPEPSEATHEVIHPSGRWLHVFIQEPVVLHRVP